MLRDFECHLLIAKTPRDCLMSECKIHENSIGVTLCNHIREYREISQESHKTLEVQMISFFVGIKIIKRGDDSM